ncbi:MAG: lysylphosphatidylglycerol synthase transmembrane domain-containing protein [Gemmatimonadota bacterium]|nr:lysylphosphatidylglycerol synthase transmembrane domain-containing protein [Gemmatimonadota bacterium]
MKYMKHTIALTITAVCLYIAFRGVSFDKALEILDTDNIRIVPLAVFTLISLGVMWARAWRWKYFYREEHNATVSGLTVANLIGFGSNNILPLRIGELVRVLIAKRKVPKASMSYTVGALVIERFLDTLCLLACLILPLVLSKQFPPLVVKIGVVMTFVFAGAVIILFLLRGRPELCMKIALPVGKKLLPMRFHDKLEHFLASFTEGLKILKNRSAMIKIILLSLFHWWLVVFSYSMAFKGFSFDSLPWSAAYLTLGFVGLGVALPSAPAYIGPIHAAIIYALSDIYGIEKSAATGFAVIMHLLMMCPITVVCLALMWKEGISLGQIRQKADHIEDEDNLTPQ